MINHPLLIFHIGALIGFLYAAYRMGRGALIAVGAVSAVLANLFVIKQVDLFGCTITCSDAYSVGAIFALNLCQNRYGKGAGLEMVKVAFLSLALFGVMSQVHLWYVPAGEDWAHGAFSTVLSTSPRILAASLIAFLVSSRIDVEIFPRIRQWMPVWLAIPLSVLCTQTLDTIMFGFLGLYGIVGSLFGIIIVSLLAKLVTIALMGLGSFWVRRHEV